MDTKELIKAISADAAKPGVSMRDTWALTVALSIAAAAMAFMAMLGPRPDFVEALTTTRFLLKFVVTITVVLTSFAILSNLARPAGRAYPSLLFVGPGIVLCCVFIELLSVPSNEWEARLIGTNSMKCLAFIPLIGLGPLIFLMLALRHGAPTRPTFSGAVAGLLAGGVAATFYASHCPDDSPLFVATWYTIAIVILVLAGMVIGPRLTRW